MRSALGCPLRIGLLFIGLLFIGLGACAPAKIPAPPPGPRASEPTDAIPPDLDLVVRLDVAKMRRANSVRGFGLTDFPLRAGFADRLAGEDLLEQALERADTAWIAVRPGPALGASDNVVVLRGAFVGFDPRRSRTAPRFQGPADLGAGWRLYERVPPASRAQPVRIYARHEEWLVFVSNAEVDSTERAMERGAEPSRTVPPAKGALSLTARARPIALWVSERWPPAADLLREAVRVSGHADLDSAGLEAEVEIRYETERQAQEATRWSRELLSGIGQDGGLIGRLARELRIESVANTLVLRLALGLPVLSAIVRCLSQGDCASRASPSTPGSNGVRPSRVP